MKKSILYTSLIIALFTSCQQAQPVFFKHIDAQDKSIAVPISSSVIAVNAFGAYTSSPFLLSFKEELRTRGWRLVVQGVTGRAGETQSINSGAKYTFFSAEGRSDVNCVLVENATGEEVMILQGTVLSPETIAKKVAEAIEQHSK